MSDHEFNNYLTLLASLLRLGDKQRRAIAEELRTHLEDRLDELLARGLSREDAIQRALAEFGDAAGLAAQFASISRGRRRRWLMRAMTFSVAAMLLMAAGLAILWPGRNAGPGGPAAIAQVPAADPALQPKIAPAAGKGRSLEEVLSQRMDLDFNETPLRDVAAQLTERTGITFHLNAKAINDSGIDLDAPVTARFRSLRLSTMLELILADVDLTYTERAGELIVITTSDDAESRLENRVYDCRDLLAMQAPPGSEQYVPRPPRGGLGGMGGGGLFAVQDELKKGDAAGGAVPPPVTVPPRGGIPGGGRGGEGDSLPYTLHDLRAEQLTDLITTNVAPQSWDLVGGPGSISEYNGLIVVAQTVQIHKEVEHVLNMLREAAGLMADKDGKPRVVR